MNDERDWRAAFALLWGALPFPLRHSFGGDANEACDLLLSVDEPEAISEADKREWVVGLLGLREPPALPPGRWVVAAEASDGTPPFAIGIVGKGEREFFDTRQDAERAVVLLNRAWAYAVDAAPPEGMDFSGVALEVLCRVFDDGADARYEKWLAWYDPTKWLHPSRALGAFIRTELDAAPVAPTVSAEDVFLAMQAVAEGWSTAKEYAERIADRINAHRAARLAGGPPRG